MTARARLAALAAAAEYPPATLTLIAEATLPRYRAGEPLDHTALGHVASAVEVLTEAGIGAAALPQLVQRHQRAAGARWRDSFWAHALRTASARVQPDPVAPREPSGHATRAPRRGGFGRERRLTPRKETNP
jgi:hypothetical protein